MAEVEKTSFWKKILKKIVKSPINSLFLLAIVYFAMKAFLFSSTFSDKITFYAIIIIWILYFVAKQIFLILILLLLAGSCVYLYYNYTQRDAQQCEQNGGYWNKKSQICEEKKTSWERLKAFWERNNQKQSEQNKERNEK